MKLLALIKKEFYRFFHDPKLIVTILLPGIIIFLIYNVIGAFMNETEPVNYDYKVCVAGTSATSGAFTALVGEAVKESDSKVEFTVSTAEEGKAAVEKGEADACLVFSENFGEAAGGSVEIYYDGARDASSSFYGIASAVLQASAMRFAVVGHNFETTENLGKTVFAGLLPFLVAIFIFSACMSVTLESVAGEKERGTLATILATSAKRHEIALGKILPLSCISALGAASSFLGVALSLPKLVGTGFGVLGGYAFGHYALLFLLILSIVPLIVSAIACVSTLSRSVKEASAYTSVIMILVMVVSILSIFLSSLGNWYVAVPVLNAVISMGKVLGGELAIWQSLVSVGANLLYTALLVFLISKMFSSERIMFGK